MWTVDNTLGFGAASLNTILLCAQAFRESRACWRYLLLRQYLRWRSSLNSWGSQRLRQGRFYASAHDGARLQTLHPHAGRYATCHASRKTYISTSLRHILQTVCEFIRFSTVSWLACNVGVRTFATAFHFSYRQITHSVNNEKRDSQKNSCRLQRLSSEKNPLWWPTSMPQLYLNRWGSVRLWAAAAEDGQNRRFRQAPEEITRVSQWESASTRSGSSGAK